MLLRGVWSIPVSDSFRTAPLAPYVVLSSFSSCALDRFSFVRGVFLVFFTEARKELLGHFFSCFVISLDPACAECVYVINLMRGSLGTVSQKRVQSSLVVERGRT